MTLPKLVKRRQTVHRNRHTVTISLCAPLERLVFKKLAVWMRSRKKIQTKAVGKRGNSPPPVFPFPGDESFLQINSETE